jgi:hypothetical protein
LYLSTLGVRVIKTKKKVQGLEFPLSALKGVAERLEYAPRETERERESERE